SPRRSAPGRAPTCGRLRDRFRARLRLFELIVRLGVTGVYRLRGRLLAAASIDPGLGAGVPASGREEDQAEQDGGEGGPDVDAEAEEHLARVDANRLEDAATHAVPDQVGG